MKKTLLFCLFSAMALPMCAHPVSREQAALRAGQLLGKPVEALHLQERRLVPAAVVTSPAYYMFRGSDGRGFAIVSAEDELADVLGYSAQSVLKADADVPCALALYLNAFTERVAAYRAGTLELQELPVFARAPRYADEEDNVLCTTAWGQNAPYNNLCPTKDGHHCYSGCVATAMAQIFRFWEWPVTGSGYSWAKDGNGETYSGTLEHTYNWDAMLNTTQENLASEESQQAVAELMYDCGLSVHMNYSTDGSGARTPVLAMCTNFGYIPTTLRMYQRDCFSSDEWLALLRKEIDRGRPIFHTASSLTNAGKDAAGHAFVVDGYDAFGNIHVNWGWDGDFDGYYSPEKMNPSGYQFTLDEAALIGIEPAKNGETGTPVEYLYVADPLSCSQKGTIQKSVDFYITVGNIWNLNGSAHEWRLSIGLFDVNNQLVGIVSTGRVPTASLEPGYGRSSTFADIACNLKGDYPDGDYALRLVFRETSSKEWLLPDMVGGIKKNAVYVYLKGTRVTFTDGADYIEAGVQGLRATPGLTDTPWYDLGGRRITRPGKGLFIHDGRVVRR